MTDLEQEFVQYLTVMIETTFGFHPVVTTRIQDGMAYVVLDGTPYERSVMMGKEARTLQSIKYLLRIFSRGKGYFCDLYVQPSDDRR